MNLVNVIDSLDVRKPSHYAALTGLAALFAVFCALAAAYQVVRAPFYFARLLWYRHRLVRGLRAVIREGERLAAERAARKGSP